jgi:DNA-binding transcriptional LysR family regulator
VAGPLLIGASTTIAEYILPKILGEFKGEHPEVQAHLTVANSETIVSRVADHALDVGLIESPSYLATLHNETCCDDELMVICAPGHTLAKRNTVRAADLAALPWVRREPGSGTREFTDNYLREGGVVPEDLHVMMELGSPEAMKGVVETGIAIAVLSRATTAKELELGSLVAIPLAPRLIRTLSLVYPKERFRSRLLTTFVAFATRRMRETAATA